MGLIYWLRGFLEREAAQYYCVIPSKPYALIEPGSVLWLLEEEIRRDNLELDRSSPPPLRDTLSALPLYDPMMTRQDNDYREYPSAKVTPITESTNLRGQTVLTAKAVGYNRCTGEFEFTSMGGLEFYIDYPQDKTTILFTGHYQRPGMPSESTRAIEAENARLRAHLDRLERGPTRARKYATSVAIRGEPYWSWPGCGFRRRNREVLVPRQGTPVYYYNGLRIHIACFEFPPTAAEYSNLFLTPESPSLTQGRLTTPHRYIVVVRALSRDSRSTRSVFDNRFFTKVLGQHNRLRLRNLFTADYDQADLGNLVAIAPVQDYYPNYPVSNPCSNQQYNLPVCRRTRRRCCICPLYPLGGWVDKAIMQGRGVRAASLNLLRHYGVLPSRPPCELPPFLRRERRSAPMPLPRLEPYQRLLYLRTNQRRSTFYSPLVGRNRHPPAATGI